MSGNTTPRAMQAKAQAAEHKAGPASGYGQIVLVFQGGGALGAYQAGVYQAMHEAGIEPDWVIGTSIGAINASILAGNDREHRLDRLLEFWQRVEQNSILEAMAGLPFVGSMLPNWMTVTQGISGFFKPNHMAFLGNNIRLAADAAGYYSTQPLEKTLGDLVDFDRIHAGKTRLTVGAAKIDTGEMRYFDSRDTPLNVRHVMASGALPPAFPAVRIDGDLYWDGGILSNTPVETVFDDNPRRDSLVFAVHIWSPSGPEPETIQDVISRHKDIQYSSRALSHIQRQRQLHKLRHIIAELAARLPEGERNNNSVREMAGFGCLTNMHVVRLVAPHLDGETASKDIDFSRAGIRARWQAGLKDARHTLAEKPWTKEVDPLAGFHLHEAAGQG